MKHRLLELLRCPKTGVELFLSSFAEQNGEVKSGELVTADGLHRYAIREFVPRFVPERNYAENFGIQWNRFRRTQLDSVSGIGISRTRFYRYSRWEQTELRGKHVLDVGCGAGRFTEIALEAGAHVVAVDYSSAVDACRANLGASENLDVVQADIFALPFVPMSFDYVYCFGVLQHTPNAAAAFASLPPQLPLGGKIAVDVYPWVARNLAWSKYWIRPLTKRLPPELLFALVERTVPAMLSISSGLARVPGIGRYLKYVVPVANYEGVYGLSNQQLREWATLDTFDMLAPAHDHPQRLSTLKTWFENAGLEDCSFERLGFLVGRGTKANSDARRSAPIRK
jgi:SAM-dependent methyltransferase